MNFMRDDEFLLLMNLGKGMLYDSPVLPVQDRIRLHDAGIQTAIEYPQWNELEPNQGQYNFSIIEDILSINRTAGMKTIFAVPNPWIPQWIPNDWRYKYASGVYNTSAVSIWSKEGLDYEKEFFSLLINRYRSDDVMFILEELDTGESILPSYAFYDSHAVEDFYNKYDKDIPIDFENEQTKEWLANSAVSYFVDMQRIFYEQYKEIWDAHQWLIARINPASCNFAQPQLLKGYRDNFSDLSLVLLQYTYFDHAHPPENTVYVDMLKNTYNCEVIVEAMFCDGLPKTTPKSIEKGFRGQIICPTHQHTHEKSLQGWMVDNIRNSHNQWKANYENRRDNSLPE